MNSVGIPRVYFLVPSPIPTKTHTHGHGYGFSMGMGGFMGNPSTHGFLRHVHSDNECSSLVNVFNLI